jgi:hypothetical protein
MVLVVVFEQSGDLGTRCFCIRNGVHPKIIPFECPHKGFRHAVALRTGDWREAGRQVQLRIEDAGVAGVLWRTVVGQPFYRFWRTDG